MKRIPIIGLSRQEALRDGDRLYYGPVCRRDVAHGNVRHVENGCCKVCRKIATDVVNLRSYHKHRETRIAYGKRYYKLNKATVIAGTTAWRKKNPDAYARSASKSRVKNVIARRVYNAKWDSLNRSIRLAINAKRRAAKLHATISGYDKELRDIYMKCPKGFHVDHIVPLQGKTVCGFHVPWNLQYLTGPENSGKRNKLIESLAIAPAFENHTRH